MTSTTGVRRGTNPFARRLTEGLRTVVLTVSVLALSVTAAVPAPAVVGPDADHGFAVRLAIGDDEATNKMCSGALVSPGWVLTAASCFQETPGTGTPRSGKPAQAVTATVGRPDLTASTGAVRAVVELVPHETRDLMMVRLESPVTTVAPVPLGTTAPAVGSPSTSLGYGRTAGEWSPLHLKSGVFTVDSVTGGDVSLTGQDGAAVCAGDAGGPVLSTVSGETSLVAVNSRSWQNGCFGADPEETRTGAVGTLVTDVRSWVHDLVAVHHPLKVRPFDGEALAAPLGCTSTGAVKVAVAAFDGADESNQALRVEDRSSTVHTQTRCVYGETFDKSVSFRFGAGQLASGAIVTLDGKGGTDAGNGVWRLLFGAVGSDLRVSAYDGSAWQSVLTVPGGAALQTWHDVTINATLDRAEVVVGEVRARTQARASVSTVLGDVTFASAGTRAAGTDVYVDDLTVGPAYHAAPRSFDEEALGAPIGCTSTGDVKVVAASFGGAGVSNRALRVNDQSSTVHSKTTCEYPGTFDKSVSFRFSAKQLTSGALVTLAGSEGNAVWHLLLDQSGTDLRVSAYDGAAWQSVLTLPGGAALQTWHDVTINARLDQADVVADGVTGQTRARMSTSTALTDVAFASAGTAPTGTDVYVDDLAVGPMSVGARSFDGESLGSPIGCTSTGDVKVVAASFGGAGESNQALRVNDQSSTVHSKTTCEYPGTFDKSVSFRFSAGQLTSGALVTLAGREGNAVWHLLLEPSGADLRVSAYDGSAWRTVMTAPGAAEQLTWHDVTINARLDHAEIVVDGARAQTQARLSTSTALGDVSVSSAGTSPTGDDVYVDDLAVTQLADG